MRSFVQKVLAGDSLDLYLLAAAAAVLTLLGILGVSNSETLLSGILAVLAWLAISQIRLRNMVGNMSTGATRADSFFHAELDQATADALQSGTELFVTGVARNGLTARHYSVLESRLDTGTRMRFLVVNPDSPSLVVAAVRYYSRSARSESILRNRVHESLARLAELREKFPDHLEIRVTNEPLAIGVIAVDPSRRDSRTRAIVEYYTYQAPGEPKFDLGNVDEPWLSHFLDEAEAYWESAEEWVSHSP